jgi:tRNA pseudouridine synthase B
MNGILLVDKPADWTSHDVVAKLRGVLGERRMGHSGTLDPMATGLLVVFAGRATRAVSFSENHSKCYEARLRLGLTTDTQDTTGTVLSRCDRRVTRAELEAALPQFRGDILQTPPMYSALKRDGKKLVDLARSGIEIERESREVTVDSIDVSERDGEIFLDVRCGRGTYIRTLCDDIGELLGCHACMHSLERTAVGRFSASDAYTLDRLRELDGPAREAALIPAEDCLDFPALSLPPFQERLFRSGCEIYAADLPDFLPEDGALYKVYGAAGFFAVGRAGIFPGKTESSEPGMAVKMIKFFG